MRDGRRLSDPVGTSEEGTSTLPAFIRPRRVLWATVIYFQGNLTKKKTVFVFKKLRCVKENYKLITRCAFLHGDKPSPGAVGSCFETPLLKHLRRIMSLC